MAAAVLSTAGGRVPNAALMPNRRDRFRAIMARLDGSGSPWTALVDGLYLPRPDGVAERIAKSLEIRPHGTHLVVGTIGSGKTTALLRVQELLADSAPECRVEYREAGGWGPPQDETLLSVLSELAVHVGEDGLPIFTEPTVLLVDGLDRTSDIAAFHRMVRAGLPAFESGIGLVCIGPPLLQAEPPSFESEWFDHVHVCGAVDPRSADGLRYLLDLISLRGGEAFTDAALALLARSSGGIVRDLLLLSRQALEDTYIDGGDVVDVRYVDAAIDRLGRSMLRSVTQEQVDALMRQTDAVGLYSGPPLASGRLIVDRLLIPRQGIPMQLFVHPCVMSVLRGHS